MLMSVRSIDATLEVVLRSVLLGATALALILVVFGNGGLATIAVEAISVALKVATGEPTLRGLAVLLNVA